MYIAEQPKDGEMQDNHGLEMDCKSSKVPTHFTVPEEGEHRRGHGIKSSKHKNKRTAEQKQYRKLNKQSKRVKSLQEQYRELEQQIKQLKQMVQMQIQTLTLTMKTDNNNQGQPNNTLQPNTTSTIKQLQQLIATLFSYQQTISTANSNYLLLSQVNKEQEAESLFHIGNLQERIRQLRFSLNTKQDLLAYELSTIQNPQQGGQEDEDNRPVVIDYHMPKRPTMINFNNVSIDCQTIQKAIKEVQCLKSAIVKLQSELQVIYKQSQQEFGNSKNNKENEQEESGSTGEYKTIEMSDNEKGMDNKSKGQSTTNNSNSNNCNNNSGNNNSDNKHTANLNSTSKKNITNNLSPSKRSANSTPPNVPQLYYLPLSITNYQSTLIYKAAKLNQFQKQKSLTLKSMYKQLLAQYDAEVERKKKLVSQYEIQRDIFQYKKKQSLHSTANNTSRTMVKNNLQLISQESEEDGRSSSRSVNSTQNILAELKQQLSFHSETNIKQPPTVVITVDNQNKDSLSEKGKPENKDEQEQQLVLNKIVSNAGNKQGKIEDIVNQDKSNVSKDYSINTKTNINDSNTNIKSPFLKLKLKPSYSSSTSISIPPLKPSQPIQPKFTNSQQQKQYNNNKQTTLNQNLSNLQTPIIPSNQLSQLFKPKTIKVTPIKPKLQLPAYRKEKPPSNQSNNSTISSNN